MTLSAFAELLRHYYYFGISPEISRGKSQGFRIKSREIGGAFLGFVAAGTPSGQVKFSSSTVPGDWI